MSIHDPDALAQTAKGILVEAARNAGYDGDDAGVVFQFVAGLATWKVDREGFDVFSVGWAVGYLTGVGLLKTD